MTTTQPWANDVENPVTGGRRAAVVAALALGQAIPVLFAYLVTLQVGVPLSLAKPVICLGAVVLGIATWRSYRRPAECSPFARSIFYDLNRKPFEIAARQRHHARSWGVALAYEVGVAVLFIGPAALLGDAYKADLVSPSGERTNLPIVAMTAAVFAACIYRWLRRTRLGVPVRHHDRALTTDPLPTPYERAGHNAAEGEIWWANVHFDEKEGSKDRPCVILHINDEWILVAKITSQESAARHGAVPISTRGWDSGTKERSWVDMRTPKYVDHHGLRKYAGNCPASTWEELQPLRANAVLVSAMTLNQLRREGRRV